MNRKLYSKLLKVSFTHCVYAMALIMLQSNVIYGQDCTGKSYPFFIGDEYEIETRIYSFDVSKTTGNIAFGGDYYKYGYSQDIPFLGYFKESTQNFEWMNYYYVQGNTMEAFKAVIFDNDENFVYVAKINDFMLLKIELGLGYVYQSWQQVTVQPDIVYLSALIVDKRNKPIVGLCGFSQIYDCDYKVISLSLIETSSFINWATSNTGNSNPRSFYYKQSTDVLYIGGHEQNLQNQTYLLLLKKQAETGVNIQKATFQLTGIFEDLDIKSLQSQSDQVYGCLAQKQLAVFLDLSHLILAPLPKIQ
eukprot:403345823